MEKVREILRSMSLEEKVAQLTCVRAIDLTENGRFSQEKISSLLINGVGIITRLTGDGLAPQVARELVEAVQNFLKNQTRLRIPAIIMEECLAGLKAEGATSFPQSLALASSWNTDLIYRVASAIGRNARALGVRQCLSPVLDLAMDPRWGRVEETYGEDPYLASAMGVAYVKGLQSEGVAATGKHFAGHGSPEGGRNAAPVYVSERFMRENHLRTFEAAVKNGLMSIMPAYHQLDGIPCHINHWLLRKVLREEWGFQGTIVSDGGAISRLIYVDRVASDPSDAAVLALKAGVGAEMPTSVCYTTLVESVRNGKLELDAIDDAVMRMLSLKLRLGLLDDMGNREATQAPLQLDSARVLALEAAAESIVLLKNDGVLPIHKGKRLALIGPNADDPLCLFGDYHYTAHLGLERPSVPTASVLQAVEKRCPNVLYSKGCYVLYGSRGGLEEAIEVAREADVVVAVLGDRSGLPKEPMEHYQHTVGEGIDSHDLKLPGMQEELLMELENAGKPLVLVLVSGRPYTLPNPSSISAIVEAWLPGEEGAEAIAQVLFGEVNPSGHLPMSYPKSVGQLPVYYYRKASSMGNYLLSDSKPLFPFGHGLCYTTFEYADLAVKQTNETNFEISFLVKNSGKTRGKEVPQLYASKAISTVSKPVKELVGFAKVDLEPDEQKRVVFYLPIELLSAYDAEMKLVVEPGDYVLEVGRSSEDIRLTGHLTISARKLLDQRSKFFSEVTLERARNHKNTLPRQKAKASTCLYMATM